MSDPQPSTPTPVARHQHNASSDATSITPLWASANALLNKQNATTNSELVPPSSSHTTTSAHAAIFQSTFIAPSPPPNKTSNPSNDLSTLAPLNTSQRLEPQHSGHSTPSGAGLRIQTDITLGYPVTSVSTTTTTTTTTSTAIAAYSISGAAGVSRSNSKTRMDIPLARSQSVKNVLASSYGSTSNFGSLPNSAVSSPMLNAMADVTPLPSPLMSGDSPGPWKRLGSRRTSREIFGPVNSDTVLISANGESISSAVANQSKRRAYHGLANNANEELINTQVKQEKSELEGGQHVRNRSLSEYVPETIQVPKQRNVTVSGSHAQIMDITPGGALDMHMRREPHLAIQRGLAPIPGPPTPPASRTGGESSDSDSSLSTTTVPRAHKKPRCEYFDAYTRDDAKRRRWRALKVLGQGTFSKVMLATSQRPEDDRIDENDVLKQKVDGLSTPSSTSSRTSTPESKIDRKKLVAVKICEHGPKGGASEERVEMSLKRELEIMKTIHHPSLVHLKAWNIEATRAILVLSYCPGGDLFEVASEHRDLLVPSLLRRMFSELVGAVQYLHDRNIVHRDIKLENVLVNLPLSDLRKSHNWTTYPYSLITLTDLGLSRFVLPHEKLTTRCGSDDYAAPEVIMGQPYDGRATDAWSLGVLLYALLESRLPFDPHPGMSEGQKMRSRTSHRIARVEWRWISFAAQDGEEGDGDHEADNEAFKRRGLEGAREVAEGLLKRARSRWTLERVGEEEWVKRGVMVEGGVRFREEDVPVEVEVEAEEGGL